MNILKNIFGNTTAQIISRIISSGSGFLVTILVARAFGIVGYSDLAKITALVGLFYLGIDLGANAIFLQLDEREQSFGQLLAFRFFLAAVIFFLLTALTFFLPYNARTTVGYSPFVKVGVILFSLSFFSRAIVYSCSAVFQQNLLYGNATKAALASSVATLSLVVVTVLFHMSLLWIVVAYLIGGFLEAFVSLILLQQKNLSPVISFPFLKKIFWPTLPLALLLFLNLIYFRVDMILLTLMKNSNAVGWYDYAYKYFDFLIALPLFLSNSLYPLLLQREKYSRISKKNVLLYAGLFFCIGLLLVPVVWMGAPLITFVKHDFFPSIFALRLLSLSLPIFFATNILQWIFITKKKQTFLVILYGCSLVMNIVLNLFFIPQYSYLASAAITGFSEFLIFMTMLAYAVISL